jgi:uncharacterized protein (TIGR02217 family)
MSLTFHEVQFPVGVSQGAVGGMRFSTTVMPLSSGFESRNINWKSSRGEWDVSFGLQTQEQVEELVDFFSARRGKAYGFRFKDWTDYRAPRWRNTPGDMGGIPILFTTTGAQLTFQLTKIYGDVGGTYTRVLAKPVMGSVRLLNDGLPMIESVDFTTDYTTGIVTLSDTIALVEGHNIAGAFEFDVPARFDTDDMKISITSTEIMAWPSIPVVEIRDI